MRCCLLSDIQYLAYRYLKTVYSCLYRTVRNKNRILMWHNDFETVQFSVKYGTVNIVEVVVALSQ